ncbi:GntR family transcriptional regulator [Bosea sp. LjRoot9]|uniref:GntR family transcriptional regulator n=1 Tax=Bosea sp. LjRoot9 TaxID=3342341 RepID=UPI003ECD2D62
MTDESQQLRVVPQPVRLLVENGIRNAIVSGRFAAGEHLPDRMLCELFGASRTVVREAVRLLEAEGLVTVLPNRGPFVAYLSGVEAAQIYEVRGVLEALAGEAFAVRASDEERIGLRRIYEEMAAYQAGSGSDGLVALKRRFYDVLLRGCRNDHVAKMLAPLLSRITQLRGMSLSAPGRLPHMLAEVRQIVEAIERRQPDLAAQACRDHVRRAAEVALRALAEQEHERDLTIRSKSI